MVIEASPQLDDSMKQLILKILHENSLAKATALLNAKLTQNPASNILGIKVQDLYHLIVKIRKVTLTCQDNYIKSQPLPSGSKYPDCSESAYQNTIHEKYQVPTSSPVALFVAPAVASYDSMAPVAPTASARL